MVVPGEPHAFDGVGANSVKAKGIIAETVSILFQHRRHRTHHGFRCSPGTNGRKPGFPAFLLQFEVAANPVRWWPKTIAAPKFQPVSSRSRRLDPHHDEIVALDALW